MLKMGINLLDKVIERIRGRMMDQWYKPDQEESNDSREIVGLVGEKKQKRRGRLKESES